MKIEYYNGSVEKIFCDYSLMRRKAGNDLTKAIKKRMDQLVAAQNFQEVIELGLGRPEQLVGNYENIRYSLRLTPNDRLIMEMVDNDDSALCRIIRIIGVCDYHGTKDNWIIP